MTFHKGFLSSQFLDFHSEIYADFKAKNQFLVGVQFLNEVTNDLLSSIGTKPVT